MPVAEIQPSAVKLDKLLARIESGDIKIPAFQRGFVWDQEKVLELLHSIYCNYPVGSCLLWQTGERLKATRNIAGLEIPERPLSYPVNYVLDGQQRLSTIFGVFTKNRTPAPSALTYEFDQSVFDISFDFTTASFRPTKAVVDTSRVFRLVTLFDTHKLFPEMEKLGELDKIAAQDLYSRFSNYELPVVTISGREKDEVGTIFERINSTGTRLTTLDLMVAWTWSEDFHLKEEINQLLDILKSKGFEDVPERILLQALSAMLKASTTTKSILSLPPNEVRSKFPVLTSSLERAIDFLSTHLKVSSLDFLPHLQQIVGLAYFFSLITTPTSLQREALTKWFWRTSFSKRYSAQTDEKMDEDIRLFSDLATNKSVALAARYAYTADVSALRRQTLTKQSPLSRAFLLLLAQKSPLDLTNGVCVDLGEALSSFNRKEYHHVFPQAFLRKRALTTEQINSLCNYCFLPSGSNKKISSKAPSDYFFSIVPTKQREEILDTNLLPLKLDTYKKDNYDEFLDARAQLALQYLDRLVL